MSRVEEARKRLERELGVYGGAITVQEAWENARKKYVKYTPPINFIKPSFDLNPDGTIRPLNYWEKTMTEAEAKATGKLAIELGLSVKANTAQLTAKISNKHGDTWEVRDEYVRQVNPMIFREELRKFAALGEKDDLDYDSAGLIKW